MFCTVRNFFCCYWEFGVQELDVRVSFDIGGVPWRSGNSIEVNDISHVYDVGVLLVFELFSGQLTVSGFQRTLHRFGYVVKGPLQPRSIHLGGHQSNCSAKMTCRGKRQNAGLIKATKRHLQIIAGFLTPPRTMQRGKVSDGGRRL